MATDSIVIPVELGNLDVEKFLQQLGPKLKQRLSEVAQGMVGGQIPISRPTVVAKERFEVGGKTFEATARAKLKAIEQSIGESGERDIVALEQYAVSIKEVKKKVSDSVSADAKRLADFKKSIRFKSLEEKQTEIAKFLNQFGDQNNELRSRLTDITTKIRRRAFKQIGVNTADLPIEKRVQAYQDYIDSGKQFKREAELAIAKLKDRQARASQIEQKQAQQLRKESERLGEVGQRDFTQSLVQLDIDSLKNRLKREFKTRMSVQQPKQRIAEIRKALAAGLLPIEEANALIAKESKKFVDSIKATRRSRFNEFTKRLQTVDPNVAINELDKYINNRTSTFVQDAKILRDRLQKQVRSAQQQMQQERSRRFANQALIGAGIGLGALGNAGFPLLNIGFAAMSGGPVGAAIVGVSTALGESTRAFNRFKESVVGTAKEIGFVSTGFKVAEARIKAFDAVIGSAALSSQRAANELRLEYYERNKLSGTLSDTTRLFEDTWQSVKQQFTEAFGDTLQGKLFSRGDPFWETFRKQRELSANNRLEDLLSARRNFIAQMNKSSVGIETSPYETWRRIQTAAFDPSKQEEMKIQQEQLKELNRLVAIAEAEAKLKGIQAVNVSSLPWSPLWGTTY